MFDRSSLHMLRGLFVDNHIIRIHYRYLCVSGMSTEFPKPNQQGKAKELN